MKIRNQLIRYGAVVAGTALPVFAFASGGPSYDVTDATDAITAGGTAIAALGVAALVMIVGLKVWKRLRGAA